MSSGKICGLTVKDVRFPTSLEQHGSDAMHTDPDYSAAYVIIETDSGTRGFGLTFTVGKGTEIVVCAVQALRPLVLGKTLDDITTDFRSFYRLLTSDGQMRWPVWKLLVDMTPEQLVSCIDFRYISDALTEQEALGILHKGQESKQQREELMLKEGYPAYTTSCAWLGYPDQQLTQLCSQALADGWTAFKVKVGAELDDDIRRCRLIRQMIGPEKILMIDANQRWDVGEAVAWVTRLSEFRPLWIEEPTSPDDILGHAHISKALAPLGIGVASGEQCHNRVMFKQFLQAGALQFVQIDSCRVGSVNENLAILLMASKFNVPVCPHAGGVGLCELVQHLILFDYICVSGSLEKRMCEYVDHLHEHFKNPTIIRNAHYMPPVAPGFSSEMVESSVEKHTFPQGEVWRTINQL
ncbi:mitochondrial enolase superfamily member 1 isoform X2 [Sardina pilchardus]|uniref:mitochondrial enolase superfamily member 1 isoform X2 n=1 Tax=Sardina pilchardus TaxID=27697 RepID=UPI002E0E0089